MKRQQPIEIEKEEPNKDCAEPFMEEVGAALERRAKKNKLDRAVLECWAKEESAKRQARRRRYLTAAACFLLLCIGAAGISHFLHPENYYVTAGKDDPIVNEEGNNTVIKDNEEGSELNVGTEEVTVTQWEKIDAVKKNHPDLLIPEYIPEGYEFESLQISVNPLEKRYTYRFFFNEESLVLVQADKELEVVKTFNRKIQDTNGNEILLREDIGKNGYCYICNCLCTIKGDLSDEEYLRIMDGLKQ